MDVLVVAIAPDPTTFSFGGINVRVVLINGEPWFVAADVCAVLEIANVSQAAGRLDDDEKGICQTDTPGGRQSVNLISEAGMWKLVMRSDKPQAKPFQRWVTHEVLPTIRKTGSFGVDPMKAVQALDDDEVALCQIEGNDWRTKKANVISEAR